VCVCVCFAGEREKERETEREREREREKKKRERRERDALCFALLVVGIPTQIHFSLYIAHFNKGFYACKKERNTGIQSREYLLSVLTY